MASLLVENKFKGSVSVQDTEIKFCATGRKNWYRLTAVSDSSRNWSLSFGRYGTFIVPKGRVLTLDKAAEKILAEAQAKAEADRLARMSPVERAREALRKQVEFAAQKMAAQKAAKKKAAEAAT